MFPVVNYFFNRLVYQLSHLNMPKGRPRKFDTDKAVEQAMLVFWKKGYEGTTIDELTAAMGISRPSLYAAFGNKEGIFKRSLNHYLAKIRPRM